MNPLARLRFTLLGAFAVHRDGVDVTPSVPERRAVLAALVLERGRVVSAANLAAAVWPGRTPLDPAGALRPSVEAVDGALRSIVPVRFAVTAVQDGWRLDLPDPCTDLDDFAVLQRSARNRAAAHDPAGSLADLEAALAFVTGPPLAGFAGPWFVGRRRAIEVRVESVVESVAREYATAPTVGNAERLDALSLRFPRVLAVWEARTAVVADVRGAQAALSVHRAAAVALGRRLERPEANRLLSHRAGLAAAPSGQGVPPSDTTDPANVLVLAPAVRLVHLLRRWRPEPADGLVLPDGGAPPARPRVSFEVVGSPEVLVDGRPVPFLDVRVRAVLGVLLLREGVPIPGEDLCRAADDAPAYGLAETYTVRRLRRLQALVRSVAGPDHPLDLRLAGKGWVLLVPRGGWDLEVLRTLASTGRALLAAGRATEAAPVLSRVLERVPEVPFAHLQGRWFADRRLEVQAWRGEVARAWTDADGLLRRTRQVLDAAQAAARAEPLREDLWAAYAVALLRAGRRQDALAALDDVTRQVERHLRTEPGPALQMLRARIEADDPGLLG